MAETQERFPASDAKVVVEEFIQDESGEEIIPFDYTFHTFFGKGLFILQVDRNVAPPRVVMYREELAPTKFAKYCKPQIRSCRHGPHRLRRWWIEMLKVARRVSLALPTPFISVDMFSSVDGPMIGELTPTPGRPHYGMWRFKPWFDYELGQAWSKAARRLDRHQHRSSA